MCIFLELLSLFKTLNHIFILSEKLRIKTFDDSQNITEGLVQYFHSLLEKSFRLWEGLNDLFWNLAALIFKTSVFSNLCECPNSCSYKKNSRSVETLKTLSASLVTRKVSLVSLLLTFYQNSYIIIWSLNWNKRYIYGFLEDF